MIINPGDLTGTLLDEGTRKVLVKLCDRYNLTSLANEMYQAPARAACVHYFPGQIGVDCLVRPLSIGNASNE